MRDDQIELLAEDITNYAFGAVVLGEKSLDDFGPDDMAAALEKYGVNHVGVIPKVRDFVERRIRDELLTVRRKVMATTNEDLAGLPAEVRNPIAKARAVKAALDDAKDFARRADRFRSDIWEEFTNYGGVYDAAKKIEAVVANVIACAEAELERRTTFAADALTRYNVRRFIFSVKDESGKE